MIDLLLANKAEVNIHDWVAFGDLTKVKALLKDNPNLITGKDGRGYMLLHDAAACGQTEVAKFLLSNKADVNAKDNKGETPLHLAAGWFHKSVVELLINSKADVNAKDNRGRTPLHHSVSGGVNADQKDIVELLIANKAEVDATDVDNNTPLTLCAVFGGTSAAKVLLDHKADVDGAKGSGFTPMALAKGRSIKARGEGSPKDEAEAKDMMELLDSYGGKAYFDR